MAHEVGEGVGVRNLLFVCACDLRNVYRSNVFQEECADGIAATEKSQVAVATVPHPMFAVYSHPFGQRNTWRRMRM